MDSQHGGHGGHDRHAHASKEHEHQKHHIGTDVASKSTVRESLNTLATRLVENLKGVLNEPGVTLEDVKQAVDLFEKDIPHAIDQVLANTGAH